MTTIDESALRNTIRQLDQIHFEFVDASASLPFHHPLAKIRRELAVVINDLEEYLATLSVEGGDGSADSGP